MTNQSARILGKLGGRRTLNKYGVDHFKRISQLAAEARKVAQAKRNAVKTEFEN